MMWEYEWYFAKGTVYCTDPPLPMSMGKVTRRWCCYAFAVSASECCYALCCEHLVLCHLLLCTCCVSILCCVSIRANAAMHCVLSAASEIVIPMERLQQTLLTAQCTV